MELPYSNAALSRKINKLERKVKCCAGNRIEQVEDVVLLASGWVLNAGLYEYVYSNPLITADTSVEVIPLNADYLIVVAAQVLPETISANGSVTIYSVNEPTNDINVTLNLFQL
jgi:hypothetical protein